jgi:thymidylate synthase ThyX
MISPQIDVLDHGYVRLTDNMGDDLSVVRAARVSYDADWRAGEDEGKDKKLIEYMISHGHTSPFEAVTFTFEVKAPIFVFRQWHRHRTWSYNELSARYGELPAEFYVPHESCIGTQSKSNKQGREFKALSMEEAAETREQIAGYAAHCGRGAVFEALIAKVLGYRFYGAFCSHGSLDHLEPLDVEYATIIRAFGRLFNGAKT